jgi:hypothetical protein
MKRPTADDIAIASEWLNYNTGENGEAESCKRVADWIDAMARAEIERQAARGIGAPVSALRRKLREVAR